MIKYTNQKLIWPLYYDHNVNGKRFIHFFQPRDHKNWKEVSCHEVLLSTKSDNSLVRWSHLLIQQNHKVIWGHMKNKKQHNPTSIKSFSTKHYRLMTSSEKPSLYQMLLWRHLGYENWYISTSIRPVATKLRKLILKIGKIWCNEFMEKIWNSLETIFNFFTEVILSNFNNCHEYCDYWLWFSNLITCFLAFLNKWLKKLSFTARISKIFAFHCSAEVSRISNPNQNCLSRAEASLYLIHGSKVGICKYFSLFSI